MTDSILIQAIITTRVLLSRFLTSLSNPLPNPSSVATNVSSPQKSPLPAVLPLLRDSAKLLKAHTTRISLLLLNKPFTPSAIATVLRELHSTCLPALISSAELCDADIYGTIMRTEVRARVRRALREAEQLIDEIEEVIKVESRHGQLAKDSDHSVGKAKKQDKKNKDDIKQRQLTSTGLLWSACDSLVELADMGVVELAILKTKEQRLMLEDALAELKEWSEESAANKDDRTEDDQDSVVHSSDDEDNEANILFGKTPALPAGPSPLRETLTKSLKKLQSLIIFYRAVVKHRLRSFPEDATTRKSSLPQSDHTIDTSPPLPSQAVRNTNQPSNGDNNTPQPQPHPASRLDALQTHLSAIPSAADELAAAFYSLDAPLAEVVLSRICATGIQAALQVKTNWFEVEDGFSEWLCKWIDVVAN